MQSRVDVNASFVCQDANSDQDVMATGAALLARHPVDEANTRFWPFRPFLCRLNLLAAETCNGWQNTTKKRELRYKLCLNIQWPCSMHAWP